MTTAASGPATLLELLDSHPARSPALVAPDEKIVTTYGSLRAQVQALADGLVSAGVSAGDRVGIVLPNGLPAIVSFLAASTAGVAAPFNEACREEEFRFYLDDTSAGVLLVPRHGAEAARKAAGTSVRILAVDTDAHGGVRLIDGRGRAGAASPPRSDDVALVLHTSGSTGPPKRVPLTHANLSTSAANVARTYALSADDVSLCVMPLFHVHGLVASVLATLATGGTVVVPAKFSPLSFWRIAREHRATWYSAVPTLHRLLLARAEPGAPRPAGAERLRFIRSCSAALAPQVMSEVEAAFAAPVLEAYGMTEAAHQIASNPCPPGARRCGSVGRGTGVSISIMDDAGRHLAPGERGEVAVKGPTVTSGYENDPEANAAALVDGWFRTGDQGVLDGDGYLTLTGRLKELINRGGEKISPHEVDQVLLSHPKVLEAVCFGTPHATWGEEVAAAVVVRQPVTEAELQSYCRARLASFKSPKRIFVTQSIPRTATGKIQRRAVAQAFSSAAR